MEAEAQRKTNELLAHSLSDIQLDSLENRMSVGDLAVDMGASDSDIKNINQKELDIELSDFRLTQTAGESSVPKGRDEPKKPKTRGGDQEDINLDERYIQANKALEGGDLATYSKIQREIKRYPKGMISPSATPKPLNSEGSAGDLGTQNELKRETDEYRRLLESAAGDVDDEDVKGVLTATMEEILNHRI